MRIQKKIGDDLRERAVDEERLRSAIASAREDLEALRDRLEHTDERLDRTRLGRVTSRLADYLSLAGDHEEARRLCDEAIEIWRSFGRERATFLARLRSAAIEFRSGRLGAALRRAETLADEAEEAPFEIYRDFALELRGRIRGARGELGEGRADLRRALTLRRERDRGRLVERTESLLERLEKNR